jgi:hypothetical protein
MNIDLKKKKHFIFYGGCFILLLLSFYFNLFKIIPENRYQEYETYVEALVVGKMAKAEKDGVFASAGFPGVNYDKRLITDTMVLANADKLENLYVRDNIVTQFKFEQIKYYLHQEEIPKDYCVYASHSGGQGIFYYLIQKILPFDNYTKYQTLRLINCILLALCFMMIIAWVYRNFGFIASFITFLFTFLSSWLVLFGGNGLWWSLWSFYAPFIVMLLLLEKKHQQPDKVSDKKIFIYLFIGVIIKLFFSGLEFITTSLLALFIPIIYYYWLEKKKIITFVKYSFKAGLVALGAVIVQFAVLIVQLKFLLGNFNLAIDYIVGAFVRRASFDSGLNTYDGGTRFADSDSLSFLWNNVIKDYLRGNAFEWGFVSLGFDFWFAVLIGIILFFGVIVFFLNRKRNDRKYDAFLITTIISTICPLSWFVIFKEHAFWHPQIDFIVWYMPSLLFGFAVIGVGISMLLSKKGQP